MEWNNERKEKKKHRLARQMNYDNDGKIGEMKWCEAMENETIGQGKYLGNCIKSFATDISFSPKNFVNTYPKRMIYAFFLLRSFLLCFSFSFLLAKFLKTQFSNIFNVHDAFVFAMCVCVCQTVKKVPLNKLKIFHFWVWAKGKDGKRDMNFFFYINRISLHIVCCLS